MSKSLPTVTENNLLIWDNARNKCGGFLQKKASQTSAFSKGKWQRRYFLINLDVGPKENYQLEYYHTPEDKTPRAIMSLTGATIKISSGTAFVLSFPDSNNISLNADSSDIMQQWIGTLEHVISIANLRDRMIYQFAVPEDDEEFNETERSQSKPSSPRENNLARLARSQNKARSNFVKISGKGWPTIRLDFDVSLIPPMSKERHKFIDFFSRDVAQALSIDPNMIEVISIRAAPGMDWLSLVEFDLNLGSSEAVDSDSVSLFENQLEKKVESRKKLLRNMYELIRDTSSLLYNGSITSKIDPSYAINFVDKPAMNNTAFPASEAQLEEIFSEKIEIMKIMQKYKDVVIPEDFIDHTHFNITLFFEGRIGIVAVPNPAVLTKRYCALWPFEVKQALGFMGTMQELWIDPVELVPRDSATKASPVPFTPSVRLGGQLCINCVHLTPDAEYDVRFIDRRDEALNSLSQEEMDSIKETFQRCDLDGDGGISKNEMEEIVRNRTVERKNAILQKFQNFIQDNDLTADDIEYFEGLKTQYLQQLQESQVKLLNMFEAADLNGDGAISFTEFILAEAWWLRCTINPERVHLF